MSELKEKINKNLQLAIRNNNEAEKNTLRLLLSSIKLVEVDKMTSLDDEAVLTVIQKEVKSRQETILDAQKAGRDDLIEMSKAEINILSAYLPQQMTEEELDQIIIQAIQEAQAVKISDMGKVMKIVMPKIKGRAPNDVVSSHVKQRLGQ
jgi:uncharacterized protein